MIKLSFSVIIAISITYLSTSAFAEEPYIGIGYTQSSWKQVVTGSSSNDAEVDMDNIKVTFGSRIKPDWRMEAYFSTTTDEGTFALNNGATPTTFEFTEIIGASINYMKSFGPATLYGGPSINWVQMEATNAVSVAFPSVDQVGPGVGVGIDFQLYKKATLVLHTETYLLESDYRAYGTGLELRYHY